MTTLSQAEQRKLNYPVTIWMATTHILLLAAPLTFSWEGFGAFLVFYFLTACLGITFGFHRLLTHRSLKAPRWLERFLATLGALALQGGPFRWVAHHRMHHAGSNSLDDPHDARLGFWHSHMGWMLRRSSKFDDFLRLRKFARDICADPYLLWLSKPSVQIGLQAGLGLALLIIGGWSYVDLEHSSYKGAIIERIYGTNPLRRITARHPSDISRGSHVYRNDSVVRIV